MALTLLSYRACCNFPLKCCVFPPGETNQAKELFSVYQSTISVSLYYWYDFDDYETWNKKKILICLLGNWLFVSLFHALLRPCSLVNEEQADIREHETPGTACGTGDTLLIQPGRMPEGPGIVISPGKSSHGPGWHAPFALWHSPTAGN